MSRGNTKVYINRLLKLIGENGLSGVSVPAPHISKAIDAIQSQVAGYTSLSGPRIVAELRRQDLVTIIKEPDVIRFQLTIKGVHRLQLAELRSIAIPPQSQWDEKWRMVTFDIPSRRADSRYTLTSELKRLGFVMLQNSMWFHPYPCFDQINQLLQYANLQPFVTCAEITRIDSASLQKLLKHYPNLKA